MKFSSYNQQKAVFANIYGKNVMWGRNNVFSIKMPNKFSEKVVGFREGLNGYVCEKCGDIVDESDIGLHSCSEGDVELVDELDSYSDSSVIKVYIVDDDYYEDDDYDDIFG